MGDRFYREWLGEKWPVETAADVDRIMLRWEHEYATEARYASLRKVLDDALAQATSGKGHERHDNGRSFEEQTICWVNRELGSADGARFQAVKKTLESARLEPAAAEKELLGAINYLAAAVIQIREGKK